MTPGKLLLACVGLAAAAPAFAADPPEEAPPEKMSTLVVFGDDPCPRSSAEEIVVCARQPESERYRIPKRLREKRRKNAPAVESWASTARVLDVVSQAGLPTSCTPIGPAGYSGCYQQFLAQARAERRAAQTGGEGPTP